MQQPPAIHTICGGRKLRSGSQAECPLAAERSTAGVALLPRPQQDPTLHQMELWGWAYKSGDVARCQVCAGLKDTRDRIQSVKNTQKITDAMKLVAAAKVRRAQDAVVNGRPFAENLVKVGPCRSPRWTCQGVQAVPVPVRPGPQGRGKQHIPGLPYPPGEGAACMQQQQPDSWRAWCERAAS